MYFIILYVFFTVHLIIRNPVIYLAY